ncbi:hypothetical protein MNBD_BACTEROID02-356 [hydrothermal vent metagenome]|uniref:RNA polymerase sigma-70 region 2 domain-containing protein n=1 Tax=hydrothermal vent metagenome TaxID=652676 RepID=A0A3B0QRT0_9ZZZZ
MQKDTLNQAITKQEQIVKAIQANDEQVLKIIYQNNYYKVEQFVLKNSGTIQYAKDIYQEAFIAVWQNVKKNKFTPKNDSAINGYLFTIAKNKWMDYLRSPKYKKTESLKDFNSISNLGVESNNYNNDKDEEKLKIVLNAYKQLGESCQKLLTNFYFDKKPLKIIAKELNIEEASARNKKYRCMEKLRELALNKSNIGK